MIEETMKNRHHTHYGFTLVETIVAIGVFSIFFAAISFILQQVLENVSTSRVRTVALTLAQQKLETLKNIPYDSLGTVGGIPSGTIPQSEVITVNNQDFTISTSILYIDDPFDQLTPSDPIPADYKRVRIQVTWGGLSRNPVTLVTNITPKGLESNPGGGTLYIQVLNSSGLPVNASSVTITNTTIVPNINITTLTDANGFVIVPAAPACVSCYNISVTKAGYSTDRTYSTSEIANPTQPPSTIIAGTVTQITFSIDQLGSLSISSKSTGESGYQTLANVIFALRSSKIIGYDTNDKPKYKYTQQFNTGGGTVGIPNLEWDTYTIDMSDSNYTLAASTPLNPVTVLPGVFSSPVTILVDPKYTASLQLTIKNNLNQLMSSAAATVKNVSSGAQFTKVTPATGSADFGQVFFNNLTLGSYFLVASLSGYQEATSSFVINSNQQTTLVLNPL